MPALALSFLFFFLGLTSFQAKAETSFICPQSGLQLKNITCCEQDHSTCQRIIQTGVPDTFLKGLNNFNQLYNEGYFFSQAVPNCHWASIYYHQTFIDGFYPIYPRQLISYLTTNFAPLPAVVPLKRGDIIYFRFEADGASLIRVSLGSNAGFYDHSAIYLGENLILQKENTFNGVFSVVDLETARKAYEDNILSSHGLIGRLSWTAWRRAN